MFSGPCQQRGMSDADVPAGVCVEPERHKSSVRSRACLQLRLAEALRFELFRLHTNSM
jgi:hypothetical protein